MGFKYEKQHAGISNCPPHAYRAVERVSFRFVANDPPLPDDFLPVALRPDHEPLDRDVRRCQSLGLSLFASEKAGREKFNYLRKKAPLIHKKVGTMIATGTITPKDGLTSDIERHGHFTLHEFATASLHASFKIIGTL